MCCETVKNGEKTGENFPAVFLMSDDVIDYHVTIPTYELILVTISRACSGDHI